MHFLITEIKLTILLKIGRPEAGWGDELSNYDYFYDLFEVNILKENIEKRIALSMRKYAFVNINV